MIPTIPTGTRVRIDNPASLLHGKTGRVFVADDGDGRTVVMLAASGVRVTVPATDLVSRDEERQAA